MTARARVASHGTLSFNLEYDHLIRGWQTTRDSALGGGNVPATTTAPPFTIDGFTDISFDRHRGWALRASAKYQFTRRWSVEPFYIYWNVGASPVSEQTVSLHAHRSAPAEAAARQPARHARSGERPLVAGVRIAAEHLVRPPRA
jgi:hypothetical protein